MGGMGEENVVEFGAAAEGEEKLRPYLTEVREHLKDVSVADIISSLSTVLPDVDRAVLTDEFGQDMAASFHEGLRIGAEGWMEDDLAFVGPWGFDVAEISVPTTIWQGSDDLMVPFSHGQWLAAHVPGASSHLEQGEGHLSVAVGSLEPMLEELVRLSGG
jgi:pimeloyl-ACP methyl ester carboxylesterase